ncbi:MAG: hypothetical protein JSU73_00540 [candidate division WOR-3 bacterium]|nr:MAG: hypothetical protein JSU73_00540 [candidate division WOR-3 bacterium]
MRVTPSLDTLGTFTICNPADPDLIQNDPTITFADSHYLVVWADEKHGSENYYYTTIARVTTEGAVLDTGIRVNDAPGYSESRPNVAFDGERCLVVWTSSSSGAFARFVNSEGLPDGNRITLNSGYSGGANVAFGDTGYLVVWFTGTYPELELYARTVSPSGVLGDTFAVITGSGCHRWADLVFDGTNFLIVWQTGDNNAGQVIFGQFVAPDGSLVGERFRISSDSYNRRWWPAVAASDSNFLVTWGQGTSSDIWGNIDVGVTAVREVPDGPVQALRSATILKPSDPSLVPYGQIVFDALGRKTDARSLRPGIYYVPGPDPRAPVRVLIVR